MAVIMPCYNYGQYVAEALRSIAAQTRAAAEVLVIDDGSTDDTAQVVAKLVAELEHLPLRVLRHGTRKGVVASLREGMRLTSAPLVACVDADDVCEPRYLEALTAALRVNPTAGFAYPRLRLFDAERGLYVTHRFDVARLLFEGNYIPMVALMRRAAFESTRGYRDLPTHVDWDLWLSFAEAGWPGVLVDEVLYNWRRHPRAMTYQPAPTRLRTRLDILRTHWRLVLRHLPWAVPWTASAVWRRLRLRLRLPVKRGTHLSPSGWVEPERTDE